MIKNPIPIRGIAKAEILNEKPRRETIQAVTVVPMFAPKIIPIDCVKERICAFTKLTTITVVALDDWIIAVTKRPVKTAVNRFPDTTLNNFWSLFPAPF